MPPWLIAVLILVGLIIIGLVVWLIYHHTRGEQPGDFNDPCNEKASPVCQKGLTCSDKTCKRSIGSQCTSLTDCVSTATACAIPAGSTGTTTVCIGPTGSTGSGGLNQACLTNGTCNSGLTCLNNICKSNSGQNCSNPSDCVSGICTNGVCAAGNTRLGSPCGTTGNTCISGLTCSQGYCQFPGIITGENYAFCGSTGSNPVCQTGFACRNNVCVPYGGFNGACGSQAPCAAPLSCDPSQYVCLFPNNPNSCATTNGVCTAGFTCTSGLCLGASGMGCFSGNQCSSGSCNLNVGKIYLSNGNTFNIPSTIILSRIPIFSPLSNSIIGMSTQSDPNKSGFYILNINPQQRLLNTGVVNVPQQDGSTLTYTLIDGSGSGSLLYGVYQVVSTSSTGGVTHVGNAIFQVTWNSSTYIGTLTPFNSTNGLVTINGTQYDPLEIDVSGSYVAISAQPHSTGMNPSIFTFNSSTWSALPTPNVPNGPQTMPRYYLDNFNPVSVNPQNEVGYVVGNSMYLAGSLLGIVYSPSGSIQDYDLGSYGNYPRIGLIANINSSNSYHLENGYLGYGSGTLVNPIPNYIDGTSVVNMMNGSDFSYTSTGSCS